MRYLFRCCTFGRYFSSLSTKGASDSRMEKFKVVEVGARDGLQNEKKIVPTSTKILLIEKLVNCGLRSVEATSFVSPKWVPQMADHEEVISRIEKREGVSYPVLVPNMTGLKSVILNGSAGEIAVFAAASESFSRKNTNCSMLEGVRRLEEVTRAARAANLDVRGYVSCVIGCPYDGPTKPAVVADITGRLLEAGCYEVSLGDTVGVGSAGSVRLLLEALISAGFPLEKLAVHFHDTYGQALSNVLVAIEKGIRVADSSIAGLGGCPYAKGASGNLATEDLIYMLHDLGFNTGVDLEQLIQVSKWICSEMSRPNNSKVASALLSKAESCTSGH